MYTLICVILYVLNTFTVIFLYSSMWGLKNKHLNLTRYGHGQTRLQIVRSALYSIFTEAWNSALYSIFRPKYGCYFVFRTLNGGGRGGGHWLHHYVSHVTTSCRLPYNDNLYIIDKRPTCLRYIYIKYRPTCGMFETPIRVGHIRWHFVENAVFWGFYSFSGYWQYSSGRNCNLLYWTMRDFQIRFLTP